jgi:hypothetical protein
VSRAVAVAAALALLLAGCQLAREPGEARPSAEAAVARSEGVAAPALGSPDQDWPRTIAGMRALADLEAGTWQDAPVLADLTVWLDPAGAWERVRLTYVAADAERMLTYRSQPDELRVERPRLAGLQLPVLPAAAVEAMAPFPGAALEPADLGAAAAGALEQCGTGGPARAVLYATGAPAAWDGQVWTRNPTWRATVVAEGGGVVVDPTTGQPFAPLTCVDPVLLQGS